MFSLASRLQFIATAAAEPSWPLTVMRIGLALACLGEAKLARGLLHILDSPEVLKIPYRWSPPPPSGIAIDAFIGLWALAALVMISSHFTRWASAIAAASITLYIAFDRQAFSNHALLNAIATTLFACACFPDRRAFRFWPLFLIRFQISLIYLSAAFAKINEEFLAGDVLRTYMSMPFGLFQNQLNAFYQPISWLTVAVELALPIALWIPRLRPTAILTGILLHASIVATVHPRPQLALFAISAFACYCSFLANPVTKT